MIFVALSIKITSKGPIIFWSDRVGQDRKIFQMPKYRTMQENAPLLPTHELVHYNEFLTPIGKFLRKTSLDETPQLFSILLGHMSFVGPRPALFSQNDLIELRDKNGIFSIKPGLTGLAQINGRDNLSIEQKVYYDTLYLSQMTLFNDIKIIFATFLKVILGKNITH